MLKNMNKKTFSVAPIFGSVKNPAITIALAQANDSKHMANLNGIFNS